MRIAIVNTIVPFLRGGAEVLADALAAKLAEAGHEIMPVGLPFSWQPPSRIADGMLAARLTTIRNADRLISFKFPAYLVPHEDKTLWLVHQFRQFYDLWDTPHRGYEDAVEIDRLREAVHRADQACFAGCRSIFTNSATTAERLRVYSGFDATVLHPPLPNPEMFANVETGPYVFAGGRINSLKRQLLAVQAMAHVRSSVELVVAGAPELPSDLDALLEAREASGRPERITIIPRFIDEAAKAELVNRSLACVYLPVDEDSYGYVTLEGAQASKPLVTTADSGGVTQLVLDGRSGIVCQPDPIELARAFDALAANPAVAKELGDGAHERMLELGLSWDHVIDSLLA